MAVQTSLRAERERELVELIRGSVDRRTNGAIRDLCVSLSNGAIVIAGRTSRFYFKQLATSAVLDELSVGEYDLRNGIEVGHRGDSFLG